MVHESRHRLHPASPVRSAWESLTNGAIRGRPLVGAASAITDDRVVVEVSNTGPTVPPYEIPTLFEPFRRLGADRLVTAKGSGLGLSIVRSVARAHGGEVTAHPREGGGLVVTAVLCRAP